MLRKILSSTLFWLVLAVVVGITVGPYLSPAMMNIVVTLRHLFGQLIAFFIPLIVLAFIASSIVKMGQSASRSLALVITLAYLSSVGAAMMSMWLGYNLIPGLDISQPAEAARKLPELLFELNIPAVMSVMSALVLAILVGLSAVWTSANQVVKLLEQFQSMVLLLIERVLIPLLPLYVAVNFCSLSSEGTLRGQMPIFINVIWIVLVAQVAWLMVLYLVAWVVARRNPFKVLRYYITPYFTALGTMSSAVTMPVALRAAHRSGVLSEKSVDFAIPILSNIHLCGSMLTETFFVMAISQMLYGHLPALHTMVLFIVLLGVFAIGAPGVPGGTVIASLGIVTSILGFDAAATALLLTVFALQDSFGTACNVVGDGAITMIVDRFNRNIDKMKSDI